MTSDKLRRQITFEAARLLVTRRETEFHLARRRAVRRLCRGHAPRASFPSQVEIRDEIERFTYLYAGDGRFDNLRELRTAAWRLMRRLDRFAPRLVGSVLTGEVRHGVEVVMEVFTDSIRSLTSLFDRLDMDYAVARERVRSGGGGAIRVRTRIHVRDGFQFTLRPFRADSPRRTVFASGPAETRRFATITQLEELIAREYPDARLEDEPSSDPALDRFQVYRMLLAPLEQVRQRRTMHPEGDALYHSLQVFELARDQAPYDEEFLLAALLHDVGKGIDPLDPLRASLEALRGYVTERTEWMIENHADAKRLLDGTLGIRAKRRLHRSADYDELLALARCDRAGRVPGGAAPELDEALEYVRDLARLCG